MSSLKMYNFSPKSKGKTLPEGFAVTKYKGEEDIEPWIEICSQGLVDPATARQRFIHELTEIDGPDPYLDTYFIEKDGEKVFLLTGDGRIPALSAYIKAGFLPVNYIDDEGKDMVERWQNIVNILKIKELPLLDDNGEVTMVLKAE